MKTLKENADVIFNVIVVLTIAGNGFFAMHCFEAGDYSCGLSALTGLFMVALGYLVSVSFWTLKYQRRDKHEN